MINAALQFLASRLDAYLRKDMPLQENLVVVSRLMENDGKETESSINKLNLFLVNVEKDSMAQNASRPEFDGFRTIVPAKKVYLNLYVLLAANFKNANYAEALKYLSKGISFFQDHSVFDRTASPDMPEGLEKLMLDMENMGLQDMNSLWGMLGCKYVPSVMYRIRTVALGSGYSYYRPYVIHVPENSLLGAM